MIFPASTTENGQCMAFPDVCKTPAAPSPIPLPYPNIAMCADGSGSSKVKINNKDTLRKGDKIRMSSGDEAGALMGVTSNQIKGAAEFKMGFSKVKVEGKEIVRLTSTAGQNGNSANMPAGVQIAPSQTKVKVMG